MAFLLLIRYSMNTDISVSTAIFYGKVKKRRAELALPADESEDEIGFSDHEDDVDWTVDGSSDGDSSGKLAQKQTRQVLV